MEPSSLELQTPRLTLRGYRPEDLAAVHGFAADPRLAAFVEWGPNTLQDSRDFLAACRAEAQALPRRAYTFAITPKDGGAAFGSAGLTLYAGTAPDAGPAAGRTGEIGYVIAADRWNLGYATEAAAAVVHFGFRTLGLERIRATCRPGNIASARVLEKAGLTLEARLPAHKLIRGSWEDSLLYSASRPLQHGAGTAGAKVRLL